MAAAYAASTSAVNSSSGPSLSVIFQGWPGVDIVLRRCAQRRMSLTKALRSTDVTVCEDGDGQSPIETVRAIQWIEAAVVLDDRRTSTGTPEPLFPNAQIVLARLARTLRTDFHVDVRVVAIPRTAVMAA